MILDTGYWKFNNSFLTEKNFVDQMNHELEQSLCASVYKAPGQRWELLKRRIKLVSQKYARNKTSEDNIIISQLSEKVNEYEENLPLREEDDKILQSTKDELEEKLFEKAKGMIFRSKVRWYEEGEKSTKYFFSLEKARYNAKTCYKIIDENQIEIEEPTKILEVQRKYFQELYKQDKEVKFTLQNKYNIMVPQQIKEQQDIQLTLEDLQEAAKLMKNNKTPGEDGIPIDFYKVFWSKIKLVFYETVLQAYTEQKLHDSARNGILNLIPKPNKDSRYIKNLRPITLLNSDYKIIEKAIANKMIPALDTIIHSDQRGFMKNRRISVNIRKMLDIIHQVDKEDMEAVVLSLDFVKCFDKCSFDILHGSLEFFGFGTIVKEWTIILYNDYSVKVQNNGNFSSKFKIEKGVHQGGCCSSIYFLVIAEILALSLRDNKHIDGITIADIKNLLNQFADDMDIFSLCNQKSLVEIHRELTDFHKQSGFTVSYDKTTLYRIGSLRHSNAQMYNIDQYKWSNKDINVLGVHICHENIVEKNYEDIVSKVNKVLQAWHNRGLSLIGKVQVVNSLIASLFVYKMMVLPVIPLNIIKSTDNAIRNYLWNGKKAKIAYKILQCPKKEGGLNLVNLLVKDKALKATWPIILNSELDYAQLVYYQLKCSNYMSDIWRSDIAPQDVKKMSISNQFWKDVLLSWSEYNYYHYRRLDNQLLWYNSNIKVKDKPIMWNDVYNRGLWYVYQLFESGSFKSEEKVKGEYGLNIIRYNAVKSAIPSEWKGYFKELTQGNFLPVPPHNYDAALLQQKSISAKVYTALSEDRMVIHDKFIKWKKELGPSYDDVLSDFCDSHCRIYRVTNVTKYRSFQYRLLQRAIVTNINLYKWNLREDDMCERCTQERESLSHMLVSCPKITSLWEDVEQYIATRFNVTVVQSVTTIIMNT